MNKRFLILLCLILTIDVIIYSQSTEIEFTSSYQVPIYILENSFKIDELVVTNDANKYIYKLTDEDIRLNGIDQYRLLGYTPFTITLENNSYNLQVVSDNGAAENFSIDATGENQNWEIKPYNENLSTVIGWPLGISTLTAVFSFTPMIMELANEDFDTASTIFVSSLASSIICHFIFNKTVPPKVQRIE